MLKKGERDIINPPKGKNIKVLVLNIVMVTDHWSGLVAQINGKS